MAIAALLVRFDGGARRLVFIGHVTAPAAVAQPVTPPPSPPAAATPQAPSPKPAARAHYSVSSVTLGDGAGARDGQPSRSRRHRHEPLPDEDATLPPTPELSGESVGSGAALTDPPDPTLPRHATTSVPRLP